MPDHFPNHSLWEQIDAVLVINLDIREDRWRDFQSLTNGLIPTEKIHRVSAVYGKTLPSFGKSPWFRGRKRDLTWAARGGCILSHRAACLLAQQSGWGTILILEDDITIPDQAYELLNTLGHLLKTKDSLWDVCFLGYTEPQPPFKLLGTASSLSLVQFLGCNATHAYVIKPTARDWIINKLPNENTIWSWTSKHRAIDRWYRRNLARRFKVTASSISLFNQSYGYSDIEHRAKSENDKACITQIRPSYSDNIIFQIKRWSIVSLNRLLQCYDVFRSGFKRIKGF